MIEEQPCVVSVGSWSFGIKLVGPFQNRQEAAVFAMSKFDDDYCWEIINIYPYERY